MFVTISYGNITGKYKYKNNDIMKKNNKQTENEQCIMPSVTGSMVWKATMQLRWIKHTEANEPRLGVRFANDVGWGWPDNIVLQQKWISDEGNEKWEDVELFKLPQYRHTTKQE